MIMFVFLQGQVNGKKIRLFLSFKQLIIA